MIARRGFSGKVLVLCLWFLTSCTTGPRPMGPAASPGRLFAQGAAAFGKGEYQDAADAYRAFVESAGRDPRLQQAVLGLAKTLFALDEIQESRRYAKQVRRDFPGTEEEEGARLLLSRIAYREGDREKTLAQLRALLREARSQDVLTSGYLLRGRIFLERGDLTLGFSQWKKSLLLAGAQGESIPLYEEMVEVLDDSVTEETLVRLARETPGGFPGDIALFAMGKRAWEGGEPVRASQIFEKFSDLFPGHLLLQEAQRYRNRGAHIASLAGARIGCIVPLSGPFKEIGEQLLQGVHLSVDRLNAMFLEEKVELIVKDSGGDAGRAATAIQELAEDAGVVAVIGPVISRSVVACAMVAEDAGLPMITPTATAEGIAEMGRYIFRNAMTNQAQARTIAHFAIEQLGLRSFVVLYPDDYYGRELHDLFLEEAAELGGEVIASASYTRGSADFGPQIREIVQKDIEGILSRNADMIQPDQKSMEEWKENYFPSFDAVYLPGYAEDVGLMAPQLVYYNIEAVQLLGSHYWNSMELIRRGERYVEGGVFTDGFFVNSPHTDIAQFVSGYRQVYGEEPTLFSAQAYDVAEMILQVLYAGGRSREDIRKGLLAQKNFPGVSGLTSVTSSGEMEKKLFLIRVEDGTFKQIN